MEAKSDKMPTMVLSGDPGKWSAAHEWPADSCVQLDRLRELATRLHAINPAWLLELDVADPQFLQLVVRRVDTSSEAELAAAFAFRSPSGMWSYTLYRVGDEDGSSYGLDEAVNVIRQDDAQWDVWQSNLRRTSHRWWQFWKR